MKIRYKKKHVNVNLILGIVWVVNGIIQILLSEKFHWLHLGWFLLSAIHFYIYYYQKTDHYLTIENGLIKQNWPFGKKLNLEDIIEIKHFSGDYILKSKKVKMTINIQAIAEESITDLKVELKKLNAEWI